MALLANIKNYIIGVLLVLALGFGYASYDLYGDKAVAKAENALLIKALEDADARFVTAQASWKATEDTLEAVDTKQDTLDTALQRDLAGLCKPAKATPQGVPNERSKTNSSVPRDGRLDDDLVGVLHNAYCQGNGNDLRCSAQADDKATQSR